MIRVSGVLCLLLLIAAPAGAQVASDDYFRFMPIGYPHLVRQTAASERFALFGDSSDPDYRDVAPADGIDDRRADWLRQLSVRFAPLMVRNSPLYPVDFRAFYDRPDFAIQVDAWDLARHDASYIDGTTIPLGGLAQAPCTAGAAPDTPDCRLLELLETWGPGRSPVEPEATAGAEENRYTVMYMDFPGYDERTWKEEYWPDDDTRSQVLAGTERSFVHPFVAETSGEAGTGFEFVLQYWFFYPVNDGPNNHEGDWEHINVIVSPQSRVTQPLDAAAVAALISGDAPLDGDDPLVVRRVEYYLHHYVYDLEFGSPNAYAPRADWEAEVEAAVDADHGSKWLWERIRERAWQDAAETRVNPQPIVWIGGDAIGVTSALQKPGLRDRDGHPSYPFRGYYKQIGPGSGERVTNPFEFREFFANPASLPEHVEDYGVDDRITLVPDWERIADLVMTSPEARREWAWLVLPLRFGFPATPSPGAGTVSNTDLGNVSVVGPSFNGGWNRIGDSSGYANYDAVKVSWATPLGTIDSFFPRLGWFNAPILYFMIKPPLDLVWRSIALPARAAVGSRLPTFVRSDGPIQRVVSAEVGMMVMPIPEDTAALFFTREQLPEWIVFVALASGGAPVTEATTAFKPVVAPVYSLTFHLSPRFSAESTLLRYDADVGFDISVEGRAEPIRVRSRLHQFEYHGNTRFNLTTGRVRPYVSYGGGITYYQLRGTNVNGVPLLTPNSPRFQPKGSWRSFFFNESVFGGGVDIDGLSVGPATIGLRGGYSLIHHPLGFEKEAAVEFDELAKELAGNIVSIWRHQLRAYATITF